MANIPNNNMTAVIIIAVRNLAGLILCRDILISFCARCQALRLGENRPLAVGSTPVGSIPVGSTPDVAMLFTATPGVDC